MTLLVELGFHTIWPHFMLCPAWVVPGNKTEELRNNRYQVVVGNAFNPSTPETETGGSLSSEANLDYRVSSRTVRVTQRRSFSKAKQNK